MEKITDVACVKNEIYKDSIYNLSKILKRDFQSVYSR